MRTIAGCASARGAWRGSTTAIASITWSGSSAPTRARIGETTGAFDPPTRPSQIALGESLLRVFQEDGAQITAEDLGSIPDFVRATLLADGRAWLQGAAMGAGLEGGGQAVHRSRRRIPSTSVVTTSVSRHRADRALVGGGGRGRTASVRGAAESQRLGRAGAGRVAVHARRCATRSCGLAYHAGSDLLLLPVQDAFGWRDRINTPATIGDDNWTWRMPIGVDALETHADADGMRGSGCVGSRRNPSRL